MPNDSATSLARAASREASAVSVALGACAMAGIVRVVAIDAAPRTPQRILFISDVFRPGARRVRRRAQRPPRARLMTS